MSMEDSSYAEAYRRSIEEPEAFWIDASQEVDWVRSPTTARTDAGWFADGVMNTCFNAIDRHVEAGRGEQTALIYDSPVSGQVRRYSFAEMRDRVSRVAGMIAQAGAVKGDRVVIYMPMVPEAMFAMLACARIGVVHSVVFGGFAAAELAKRIDDCEPALVLAASCGIEPGRIVPYKRLLDEALALASHTVARCIVLQRSAGPADINPERDIDWSDAVADAPSLPCVDVASTDPLYILYTSGTTGAPKGVIRDNGGHAVALTWSMKHIYGAKPGDTFWAASDLGWVVGHSYIVYAPLLHGCTTVLYEGKPVGTPDAGAFWRVIREYGVDIFFTAPTAIRVIRREDPDGSYVAQYGIGRLRAMFLAGERAYPETVRWAEKLLKVPVVDHWWQTELGWLAIATCLGLGQRETEAGSSGFAVPGYAFEVLDADHRPVVAGDSGDLVIRLPLPPGCLPTLWNNAEGFRRSYLDLHPRYYATGDTGFRDEAGRIHIMSRIDDIINVAGHRLSTAIIEQIIASHPEVAECAVVGLDDEIKGNIPVAVVVPRCEASRHTALTSLLVGMVRNELGPVASFKTVIFTTKLPKTRSGKILRKVIRDIGNGKAIDIPATLEDSASLAAVEEAFGPPSVVSG